MTSKRPGHSLREAMSALAREELAGKEHPETSRLVAYHRGELPPAEAAAIREHLSLCDPCAEVVLDAADFFAAAADAADEEDEETAPADLDAAWEEIRAATGRGQARPPSPATPAPMPASPPPPRRPLYRSLPFAYGLAATFAVLSLGLVLFRGASAPSAPQVNAGLYDLTSINAERSERTEPKTIRFRSPEDIALLILNPEVASHAPRHGVRIRNAQGGVVWSSEDLEPQEPGGFRLGLTGRGLPAGRYSVELYGITGSQETPVGTYPIVIEK